MANTDHRMANEEKLRSSGLVWKELLDYARKVLSELIYAHGALIAPACFALRQLSRQSNLYDEATYHVHGRPQQQSPSP